LVVLGPPGAGKTVLAIELLVRLIGQRQRADDAEARAQLPVPVRFALPAGRSGTDITLHLWWRFAGVERVRRWNAWLAAGLAGASALAAGMAVNGGPADEIEHLRGYAATFSGLSRPYRLAGLAFALGLAGQASLRYLIATGLAARDRHLPLRIARFLNWARQTGPTNESREPSRGDPSGR
jgi:hypothetical protein